MLESVWALLSLTACPLECLIITGLTTDPHIVAKAAAVLISQTSATSDLASNYFKDAFISKLNIVTLF